jgi:hypothetical protein
MPARLVKLTAAVAITSTLAGCGLNDPYSHHQQPVAATSTLTTSTSSSTTATDADPAPERGGTIPQAAQASQGTPAAAAGSSTPRAALERYARLYVNWTASTVAGVQRDLAALSVGQAHAQALQAAASYGRDTTLQTSHVTNTGTVIAIDPGQGTASGLWVIVTSEQTTGAGNYAGLPPTVHVTYAQVSQTQHEFVVSRWSPQS